SRTECGRDSRRGCLKNLRSGPKGPRRSRWIGNVGSDRWRNTRSSRLNDLTESVRVSGETRDVRWCLAGSTFNHWDVSPHRFGGDERRIHLASRGVGGRRNGRLTRKNPAFTTRRRGELRWSVVGNEL